MDHNWFLENRGISAETLEAFGVQFKENEAWFPYQVGYKIRGLREDGSRYFRSEGDMRLGLFGWERQDLYDVVFIVEGETDTLRLAQELRSEGKLMASVYGISGTNGWRSEFAEMIDGAKQVFVILDNDQDYQVKATVDRTWLQMRRDIGLKATRLHLPLRPEVVKDVCDFFDRGFTLDDLRLIAETAPQQALHYQALDLTAEPEPVDWLVNDLIAKGDVAMEIGAPNIGKSFLSMDMAAKVANGGGTWLGHSIMVEFGRVLYVDEENPEDVVRWRMKRLGVDVDTAKNIRYLHQQGIRLDTAPEKLLDEAIAFAPDLIVLDSLTRLHTQEENNAGAIASIFNDGINPLARVTGATVFVLHHINQTESSNSFIRARGSSDLGATIDVGLDVRKDTTDWLNVIHYKNRRRSAGQVLQAQINDTLDGGIEVISRESPVF